MTPWSDTLSSDQATARRNVAGGGPNSSAVSRSMRAWTTAEQAEMLL